MKSYLSLVPISAKVHKRQSRMTWICIVLAVFLVTSIISMAEMWTQSELTAMRRNHGDWHIALQNLPENEIEEIISSSDVAYSSWYSEINENADQGYYVGGKNVVIYGVEETYLTGMMNYLPEGSYPQTESEVALSAEAKELFGINIGDQVVINTPAGDFAYTVSGFYEDDMEFNNIIQGCCAYINRTAFDEISSKNEADTISQFYIRFQKESGLKKLIADLKEQYHLTDENIHENTGVLGLLGASSSETFNGLYPLAAACMVIILAAGVLMISGCMNSNVAQRTSFFGMLRCIGASKQQIVNYVRLEALNWCKSAIPIGCALGTAICWICCAILRFFVKGEWADMPLFAVSPAGILCGAVVGIITVLIAAHSPAKQAAKVSPAAAVTGNTDEAKKIVHAANTKLFKVETSLGINHATRRKKNLFLMTGSFALTIILFLTFSACLDVVNKLLPSAVSEFTPDITIASENDTNSIDRDLLNAIEQVEGVDWAFGFGLYAAYPVEVNGNETTIDLFSHDEQLLDKFKNSVVSGDIEKVYGDKNYAMAVYNQSNFKVTISSADENAPMPTGGSTIELDIYGKNSAFGNINYTEKDIGKTYTYTIKETAGNAGGMTYSQAVYEVKVTVAVDPDDASKLDVSSTMTKVKDDDGTEASAEIQENTAAFTNTYKADPTDEVTIGVGAGAELSKTFEAGTRGWKDTDEFTFKIAQSTSDKYQIDLDTDVAEIQHEATVTVGKPSSGNTANFTFGPYTFEYADTYHFTVTEQNGGQTIDGITYDGHVANVTVTVEDKGTGKLTATVAISNGKFTNTYGINPSETYELDGDTFLRVVKELKGRGWTDNDRFTFKIEAVGDNAPMPAEDTITIDADTPDHAAAFGDITFEAKHLTGNATYQYKITEVEGNLPNMQYDNREITVTVTLEDDGSGELDATVTYSGGELKFTNTYVDPGNVSIKPADITIYMGGEDGYEAVVGEDGSTVETNNSLPEPLFYIEMPEGSTGDPLDLIFNSTEEIIDPETEEHHTKAWRVSELAGQDSEGNNLYYMESVYAFQDDVRVQYVNGDTAITNDQFDPSVVNNLFEDFTIELYTGTVNVGGVTAVLEGSDEVYGITTATGTLRVRAVENGDGTESTNPVFGVQSTAPTTRLPSGQAAVVSNAVYYLLNDTTVKVAKDGVGLLFDDIYDSDNGNNERENALIEKTDEVLGSEGSNVTRHYEAKYLDLVDANNGNAWVKTDGETVTVYWPYPTGTDQNTEFDLLHFAGLHRDTDGGLSGYSPDDIDSVTPTAVEWHTDEAGIYFTVESGGFSPFVLVWETTSSSGGSSSSNKPDDLNTEDHFAYIIGYPKDYRTGEPTDDESLWPVEPQGNITRAEVATIFFRMLTDDARSENWSQTNSFTDVASTEWYNNAISTLANMGIISGDPDGSFRPDDSITRAEFTKIAVGFFDKAGDYVDGTYEDVSASDWYADFIDAAVDLGLIEGYPDGTIRPNASITRAEACTIVNRTLGRVPDKDHLLAEDEMRVWPDNSDTDAWYYAQIQEATNSHDYNWITEDGEEIEEWTDKLADRDWAQLEREWSDANSAPGGEVVD